MVCLLLKYYDICLNGDILSCFVNDMDNIVNIL